MQRSWLWDLRYSLRMRDSGRNEPTGLWSLILAAGGSSRLGMPKQLLRFRSRSLLSHAIVAAEAVTPGQVLVVLGAHALKLRLLLRRYHPNVYTITNADWSEGMAGSLGIGLSTLPARADAALLLVCDQPGVGANSLRRLVHVWQNHPGQAAAAQYTGQVGVPVVLPRRLWPKASQLTGDIGARRLLREEVGVLGIVPMPEAAFDVDTVRDRARLYDRDFRR